MENDREEMRREIDNWFELNLDAMIADLGRLVAVRSVRGPAAEGAPYGVEARAVLELAASMLEGSGFAVTNFEDIVISADLGPGPPLLGALAHLDIVDAGDGWDTDPYEITIKDGKIYGRGAYDNKGPAAAAMYAMRCVRELCPELRNGFRLILGSGEEMGFEDVTQYLRKTAPPPYVFTPDAEFPVVNVEKGRFAPFFGASWEKSLDLPRVVSITGGKTMNAVPDRAMAVIEGFPPGEAEAFCREYSGKTGAAISVLADGGRLTVTAEGAAAHAATPDLGNNAQTALIEMLAAMPFAESEGFGHIQALSRLFPHGDYYGAALGADMRDEETGELTVNFGVLGYTELGFSGNFDSRTPACADEADLAGIVGAAFAREGIAIKHSTISKCHYTPEDSPFVQALLRVYSEYTGDPGECLAMGGQTYVHDIPGGVAFGCALPGINNNAHSANEFFGVEQLLVSAKMFAQVILDMCR